MWQLGAYRLWSSFHQNPQFGSIPVQIKLSVLFPSEVK